MTDDAQACFIVHALLGDEELTTLSKQGWEEKVSLQKSTIQARARSDGLRSLETINGTQAHGQEGKGFSAKSAGALSSLDPFVGLNAPVRQRFRARWKQHEK